MRGQAGEQVDVTEKVGAARAHAAFVEVRKEFGFVGRDIDTDGAIAFASFASEAEIERLFHFFAAPSIADDFALRHLPQQVGAATSGVFFFARNAIAGT